MNKRMSVRKDFSSEFIPVKVSGYGNRNTTCILKDISDTGISFYSFSDSITPTLGKYITVEFELKDQKHKFELEILREDRKHFGYMNGARIVGINTPNSRRFDKLIDSLFSKQYSFI